MALSRFLFSETELHLTKEGFSRSRRWFSTPLPASPSKREISEKSESTKEEHTEDGKLFVQRDNREENPKIFPKITEVHKKAVGGSLNIFRNIVSKFQNKFLVHPTVTLPQGEKEAFTKTSPNDNLKEIKESMNEISSTPEHTEQCAEVLNETTSSSNTNIEVLTENSLAPPIDENLPVLDLDSLKIEGVTADGKNIDSELRTKKRDYGFNTRCTNNVDVKKSDDLRGVGNTNGIHNIFKGLPNGRKGTKETPVGRKETSTKALGTGSTGREMNGTKGSSILEKGNKKSSLSNAFNELKSKPDNDVNISTQNGGRERNGDDFSQLGGILGQVITKTEERPGTSTGLLAQMPRNNKGPFSNIVKVLNIRNEKKDPGRIIDLLSSKGGNKKIIQSKDSKSDIMVLTPNREKKNKYGLFVSFLDKRTSVDDVYHAFDGCRSLHEVEFAHSRKLGRYKCANVFFKEEQGLKNALSKTDPVICNSDVVVQPMMTWQLPNRSRIHADVAVQCPDFPAYLLKYPSRSVAIRGLTENLSFDHLRHALGLWGPISGVAIGQLDSSVYVEFESEESKEKILEEASVTILGKKLKIHRVDAPKTTVVRISKVNSQTDESTITQISNNFSEGNVKRVVQRGGDIFDVHFKLSELPNMLKILNSLNGLVIDKSQWVARPATFIPVGIIQSLWDDPEGRKQVQGIFQNLCMKVERGRSSISSFDYTFVEHNENST